MHFTQTQLPQNAKYKKNMPSKRPNTPSEARAITFGQTKAKANAHANTQNQQNKRNKHTDITCQHTSKVTAMAAEHI